MKIISIKILTLIFCIPAYFFIVPGMYFEKNSYLGKGATWKEVSLLYWEDVKLTLTYKRNGE